MTYFGTTDYDVELARGRITDVTEINKFGRNQDIDTTEEDVWDAGGIYNWSSSADITDIVSSAADTVEIEVQGLDTDWNEVVQTKTLTGTTSVALDTPLLRVFRMKNISGTSAAGTIQCGVGSTTTSFSAANLRAQITLGFEQTLMAIYTIPAGKRGLLKRLWSNINKSNSSGGLDSIFWARSEGGVFRAQNTSGLIAAGNSRDEKLYSPMPTYAEKTDLRISGIGSTNNFDVSAGFDLYIADI